MLDIYIHATGVVFIYMCLFFAIATAIKNNGIVDVGWGMGFCVVALATLPLVLEPRVKLLVMLILLWGMRLSLFLFVRNVGKPEDFRYAQWRKEWGHNVVVRSFFQVFMLQGAFMLVIALPILLVNHNPGSSALGITDYIGTAIFLIGLFFEAVGDQQNYIFKKKPENKGKVMKYGLWRFTRHPNYFGETLIWWGIALVALPAQYGYLAFISPIIITFLLLKVSGIPMLEKKYDNNPEYQEYKKHTSAFIPMPPK